LVSAINLKTGFPKLSQGAKQSVEPISAEEIMVMVMMMIHSFIYNGLNYD